MKKGIMIMMAFTLFLTLGFGQAVDAKPRGSLKSPKQSFTQTPSKSDSGAAQTNTGTKTTTGGATAPKTSGFGGSFMKGMLFGGLAGLLFGSMFGTGFFGQMMGLLINVIAILAVIMIIRAIYVYFRNKRTPDTRRPY
ncbi:hypothetical protein ACFSL6_11725 [Paenibacillus thailandensis]|uniref:Preprotein translocase subunit Tim44 n=1 Tax=Paenibacillus thailandensis TaxID=393250 RepID=A0ABW5QTP4_9BACL